MPDDDELVATLVALGASREAAEDAVRRGDPEGAVFESVLLPERRERTVSPADIEAQEVRAQTIYANKIKAPVVQGTVHQSDDVKIKDTKGDIKAPAVSAGVIYADTIKARTVVADHIYVRSLEKD